MYLNCWCGGLSQFHINLTWVLNVKSLVGTFNQEKALVGAFYVIVKTGCGTDGSSAALVLILETETDHLKNEPELSRALL